MLHDPLTLRRLLDQPALDADPRPGTRPLAQSSLAVLGIELLEVGADRVIVRMPAPAHVRERATLLVLAESAASTAAGTAAGLVKGLRRGARCRLPRRAAHGLARHR